MSGTAKSTGYTLIEIIIVVGIMGLLVGASIAGFNTLNQRQTVLSAGKEVISIMRTAQQRAIAGIKPENDCDQLLGYAVKATANGATYTLNSVCDDGGFIETVEVRSYQLAAGLTFASTFTVQFNVQTGGASGNTGDLQLRSSVYTFTVNVNESGDISEQGLELQ